MNKRIVALTVCLLLLLNLTVNLQAMTQSELDPTQNGSLTFLMEVDGEKLNTGTLHISRVGELTEEDGNYFFTLLDGTKIMEDSQITQELAEEMRELADERHLEALTAEICNGTAVFQDLPQGLYVVWQLENDACDGYAAISPFLISVPRYANGEYTLDVVAKPKVPFEPEPPSPPTVPPPPPPPSLPQTGQLKWPVPVMAVSGAVLFISGCILCSSRKRCDHEK